MIPFPGICISSASGSGGKTLLSLGLGRALANQGLTVKPFKKGPDYIDAVWLGAACRTPATNLDLFFLPRARLLDLAWKALGNAGFSIVEGNRGLYDGLDEKGSFSTAELARLLNCPVLLCLDSAKCTRTMAALVNGLLGFETGLSFCGVVFNRVGSGRHAGALRRAVEAATDLPVLGMLPRLPENPLPERHMGLPPGIDMGEKADRILEKLAACVTENCDVAEILKYVRPSPPPLAAPVEEAAADAPVIGYVQDKAFWFYYPENLEALRAAGARLVRLSIFDSGPGNEAAWNSVHGLYLGGGFPEDFGPQIAASPFLRKIVEYARGGMPVYAECGGLMLLCQSLERDGNVWPMSGLLDLKCVWHPRPQGLGYVEARVRAPNPYFPEGLKLHAHEFHYSSCHFTGNGFKFALELNRGAGIYQANGIYDAIIFKNVWASYAHIFAPAVPCWAPNFTAAVKSRKCAGK